MANYRRERAAKYLAEALELEIPKKQEQKPLLDKVIEATPVHVEAPAAKTEVHVQCQRMCCGNWKTYEEHRVTLVDGKLPKELLPETSWDRIVVRGMKSPYGKY